MRLIDADAMKKDIEAQTQILKLMFKDDEDGLRLADIMYEGYMAQIDKMPTIEPEQQWIPCSERLPSDEDYDETFTVTIQCEHYDGWDDYVTGYADWTPHGWDIQSYYMGQIKVIAWMPLPEAWKGEEC